MRRTLGLTVLAVFIAWYAVGCALLAIWALARVLDTPRWWPTGLLAATAALAGLAAVIGLWNTRAWAARAVAAWGTSIILTFSALFLSLQPAAGEARPWWALGGGIALFLFVTWGSARYVRTRLP